MKKYVGDFETCTWLKDETFVWAWAVCEIGNEQNIQIGNNIDSFLEFCQKENNPTIYFHNLKFDSEFIIYWALKNGYTHVNDRKEADTKTFTTLIGQMGEYYSVTLYFKKEGRYVRKVTFYDSLKIIPFSVDKIAKSFNLPISKLKIDYNKPRKKCPKLTPEEKAYITNDVLIVAKALNILFTEGLTKMTQGSNALSDFTKILTKDRFEELFPELTSIDEDLRRSYKGGFTYLNPIYKGKEVGKGVVLDVNSLYPSVMYEKPMPFDIPIYFEGKYETDKTYPLYIQMITCSFEIKENMIPTIQIKKHFSFLENEYLKSSNSQIVSLVLTNVDLKLFLEHYNVYDLEYKCGWKFKSMNGLFTTYIDKWIKRKNEATISGNNGQRTLAKLMLNSLYRQVCNKNKIKKENTFFTDQMILYISCLLKKRNESLYIFQFGAFITSYAREKTIRTAQAITDYSLKKYGFDAFCYSDTDSIHTLLPIEELTKFCDIDPVRLGAWKKEGNPDLPYTFTKAKFIRQKCYLEEIDGKMEITCAGMPKTCYDYVTWENFKTGFTCGGKLTFKHVKGGVKLVETEFTIKEDKVKKAIEKF